MGSEQSKQEPKDGTFNEVVFVTPEHFKTGRQTGSMPLHKNYDLEALMHVDNTLTEVLKGTYTIRIEQREDGQGFFALYERNKGDFITYDGDSPVDALIGLAIALKRTS